MDTYGQGVQQYDACSGRSRWFRREYPSGHAVKESIYYNRVTGDLSFTVQDVITMTSNVFKTNVGTGVNFMQARVGTEFGATPWSAPA